MSVRKLLGVAILILASAIVKAPALPSAMTAVSASKIYSGNVLLATGQICFQATDADDKPIPFQVGGGGQQVLKPYCFTITAGAFTGSVANRDQTAPVGIYYRITITSGVQVLRTDRIVPVGGVSWSYDQYAPPPIPPAPPGYKRKAFITWNLPTPDPSDTNLYRTAVAGPARMVTVSCNVVGGTGTVQIQLDLRTNPGDTPGEDILTQTLDCSGATNDFAVTNWGADSYVNLQVVSITGTPAALQVYVEYIY